MGEPGEEPKETGRNAERYCVAVAGGGGLIVAACISGLPAATCAAMADTYVAAIMDLARLRYSLSDA